MQDVPATAVLVWGDTTFHSHCWVVLGTWGKRLNEGQTAKCPAIKLKIWAEVAEKSL